MHRGQWDIRTITRRTSDYMLSAVVDHRPGAMGVQEHLWQATLGPEAVVFTNYPGNNQQHGQARPNFWAGSVKLPRVAMTGATVICLYRIDPDIGLGFSHAYFPTAYFDEWLIDGQWAFARSGSGYVALWGMATSGRRRPDACAAGSAQFRAGTCLAVHGRLSGRVWRFCGLLPDGPGERTAAPRLRIALADARWPAPDFGWSGPLRLRWPRGGLG
ncbi:MAG: hypothetical protein IPK52_12970 [Chloroflexi bacterium]|nr:hypothetical protein [Chloroflexota bacterium]